ncbi:PKD domain-containing protein [Massilia sp. CFBP9026]|uniref:PKD domain-containing protein n=1 Tax=Massilia sp. CFBP9026 TaxID=3096536 RepID=UPI002A6B82F2|nr:PKD domain-containing protein [Massilia sp. CFBP9026]MDY0964565.1 PKD domain-containing protein [Massilia sp. CFBP9026]
MRIARRNDVSTGSPISGLSRLALLVVAMWTSATALAQPASGEVDGKNGTQRTSYRVINLGPGTIATYPDINAAGQVAFSMVNGGRTTGFFFDGAAIKNIGSLGGGITYANDLNEAGQIAGTSINEQGVENAFVWSTGGGMLDIRAEPGRGRSYGWAINNRGVVTGSFGDSARPFRWSHAGGVEDLGVTPAFQQPAGRVLNDAGLIAGVTTIDDEFTRVFAWTRASGLVDIDTLGSVESSPVAVGAGGEVAGNRLASWDDGGDRPFLWTRATGMVDLGIGRGTTAWVNAMTPGLHIAGGIGFADGRQRAMSWTRRSGMRELGTLGGRTSVARGVNAKGQIVGFAEDKAGAMRAFVWTAGSGMLDLNWRLRRVPPTLVLEHAMAINERGEIVASSNAGLVLLRPNDGRKAGPTVGPIVAARTIEVGAPLQASVSFVDGDQVGTRGVDWSWGDGSGGAARRIDERGGVASARASHSFSAPGNYTVTATVVGRDGRRTVVSQEVEVTAP